jgi:hypothetical protein
MITYISIAGGLIVVLLAVIGCTNYPYCNYTEQFLDNSNPFF